MSEVERNKHLYEEVDEEISSFLEGMTWDELDKLVKTAKKIGGKLQHDVNMLQKDFEKIRQDALRIKQEASLL